MGRAVKVLFGCQTEDTKSGFLISPKVRHLSSPKSIVRGWSNPFLSRRFNLELLNFQSPAAAEYETAFLGLLLSIKAKRRAFEFVDATRRGRCVLIGEGDLSFALAIARDPKAQAENIIATTYETERNLNLTTSANAVSLTATGARVLHGIDACRLDDSRLPNRAELVAFQFPNTGTRRSVYGRTDNHILVRRFLRAARIRLSANGVIIVTIVNNSHHLGAFDLSAAASWADCEVIENLPFYRSVWLGYSHVNTNKPHESALSNYRSCSTWVFRPKRR